MNGAFQIDLFCAIVIMLYIIGAVIRRGAIYLERAVMLETLPCIRVRETMPKHLLLELCHCAHMKGDYFAAGGHGSAHVVFRGFVGMLLVYFLS